MPLPSKKEGENKKSFMSRCMSDSVMKSEYPNQPQRSAICMSKATEDCGRIEAADFKMNYDNYGYEEELTEENFYVPSEAEYEDWGEESEEWDISEAKPGLWENIRKKKEREGKNYKPAKKGDPDRPDPESWKKAQKPKTKSHEAGSMEKYVFESKDAAMKMANKIGMKNVHSHKSGDGKTLWMPGKNMQEFQSWYKEHSEGKYKYKDPKTGEIYQYERKGIYRKNGRALIPVRAAEYQGRKVKLGKPFLTPDGPKKRSVYVKNDKGNVVKVNFGDPNMKIKKNDPARRKSFRARHNCDNPGPRWKARYWSCKAW